MSGSEDVEESRDLSPPGSAQKISEQSPDGRYFHYNEVVGTGSFKKVYKAIDKETGRYLAWNRVALDGDITAEDFKRLYKEIQILKQVNHRNLIEFYDSWIDEEKGCLVFMTELMTSGTLSQFLKRLKVTRLSVIQNWCRQILSGLEYLHSRQPVIIHRDIKSNNIFIDATSSGENNMKIGDLGLATLYDGTSSAQPIMSVIGTPEYMAPEYYTEKYDQSVDIWAFGLVALEMLTKEVPYAECKGQTGQIFMKVSRGELPGAVELLKPGLDITEFVKATLRPAADRPSAAELLKFNFLTKEQKGDSEDIFMDSKDVAPSKTAPPPEEPKEGPMATRKVSNDSKLATSARNAANKTPENTTDTEGVLELKIEIEGRTGSVIHFTVEAMREHEDQLEEKMISFDFDTESDNLQTDAQGLAEALGDLSISARHIARRMQHLIDGPTKRRKSSPEHHHHKGRSASAARVQPPEQHHQAVQQSHQQQQQQQQHQLRKQSAPAHMVHMPPSNNGGSAPVQEHHKAAPIASSPVLAVETDLISKMSFDNLRGLAESMKTPPALQEQQPPSTPTSQIVSEQSVIVPAAQRAAQPQPPTANK